MLHGWGRVTYCIRRLVLTCVALCLCSYTEHSTVGLAQQWDQLDQLCMRMQHNLEQQIQAWLVVSHLLFCRHCWQLLGTAFLRDMLVWVLNWLNTPRSSSVWWNYFSCVCLTGLVELCAATRVAYRKTHCESSVWCLSEFFLFLAVVNVEIILNECNRSFVLCIKRTKLLSRFWNHVWTVCSFAEWSW